MTLNSARSRPSSHRRPTSRRRRSVDRATGRLLPRRESGEDRAERWAGRCRRRSRRCAEQPCAARLRRRHGHRSSRWNVQTPRASSHVGRHSAGWRAVLRPERSRRRAARSRAERPRPPVDSRPESRFRSMGSPRVPRANSGCVAANSWNARGAQARSSRSATSRSMMLTSRDAPTAPNFTIPTFSPSASAGSMVFDISTTRPRRTFTFISSSPSGVWWGCWYARSSASAWRDDNRSTSSTGWKRTSQFSTTNPS